MWFRGSSYFLLKWYGHCPLSFPNYEFTKLIWGKQFLTVSKIDLNMNKIECKWWCSLLLEIPWVFVILFVSLNCINPLVPVSARNYYSIFGGFYSLTYVCCNRKIIGLNIIIDHKIKIITVYRLLIRPRPSSS